MVELSSSAPDWPTSSASCLRSLPRAAHSSLRTTLSLLETLDEKEDEEEDEEEEEEEDEEDEEDEDDVSF